MPSSPAPPRPAPADTTDPVERRLVLLERAVGQLAVVVLGSGGARTRPHAAALGNAWNAELAAANTRDRG